MAPHFDVPSPTGSFSQEYTMSIPVQNPALRNSKSNTSSLFSDAMNEHQYSSSFSSTSIDIEDHVERPLIPGVYVPTICFFDPDTEDLDTATIAKHAIRLAKAGVTGLCTQGSNGEAVHLSREERCIVTKETRRALESAGFSQLPIVVGCGAQSIRETTQHCVDAYKSGGDYALVLPPSYYAGLFKPSSATILEFFHKVADRSPVPLIIYNYPGAVSGMDLSSDIIIKLSEHSNIVGVKLTCGNTGKLNRIAAATKGKSKTLSPTTPPFLVLGGSADFTMQSLVGGGHGILAGLANISPRSCLEIMRQYRKGNIGDTRSLQEIVARGDWTAIQGGVVSTKAGMQSWHDYGGYGRSPLPRPDAEAMAKWKEGFRELMTLENFLTKRDGEEQSQ